MCTTFLVNGTLSNGIVLGQFLPEFFHMTATRPGGIPPHRHVDFLAFSAPLMDCSCRELALCAQTVRREQSLCSKNLRKFLQMPVRWYPSQVSAGHAENSYVFINNTTFEKTIKFYMLFCLVYHPTKDTATKVEWPICTYRQLSIIKVRISPLPRADLWQIFAGLASIAIALQTLFEHRVRVCL